LSVRVRDVDILDGTPVLDLKPYVPYADAFPEASSGWLDVPADPVAAWEVAWTDDAHEQIAWLAARSVDLEAPVRRALSLGPRPNAYRRIRADGDALVLSVKEWRVRFQATADTRRIVVDRVSSGYRARELATGEGPSLDLHRAFVTAFGPR
jgi:hypothetical protein